MKILITGANGFIGRNLTEYLQARHNEVFCPQRSELDLADSQAVEDYLNSHPVDAVIHSAMNLTSVEQNLKMFFNLERCSGSFGKLISIGSGAEYDLRHYLPKMKEEYFGAHIPADAYGFSKYVIAKEIESRSRNVVNLRVFGLYGKYENYKRRFISNNICRALCGLDIEINRNMYFDYLYIDDFLRIAELFLAREPKQRSYNICTGQRIGLLTLAKMIQKIDGHERKIIIKAEGLKPEYTGDNSRFLAEFGPFEFIDPEKAIGRLYRWYQDPKNIVLNPGELA